MRGLRVNVLTIAAMAATLGGVMFALTRDPNIAMLVLGGLVGLAGNVAQDAPAPPAPSVPASTHEAIVEAMRPRSR